MYRNELSFADRLTSDFELSARRSTMVKQTYMLLTLSIMAAVMGGTIGSNNLALVKFFSSGIGWVVALVILNAIPAIAMAVRHNSVLGIGALLLDGFLAGIVLGPLLYFAQTRFPDLLVTAAIITGIIFVAVTGFVMTIGKSFSAPRGLMVGFFFTLVGITSLNFIFNYPLLSLLVSAGIGIFGLICLLSATSQVLNDPDIDSPIPGALMLFAGLFQIFQSVLVLLMSLSGRER